MPAALWLSEIGLPVRFNSWEAIFLRASRRCSGAGLDICLSPHQLRHTFAVHMLAMLIEQQIGHTAHDVSGMEAYRQLLSDPLQQVQRLLGQLHRDLTAYAEVLARESGLPAVDPVRLIVPMLERFIATDRDFAKARRLGGSPLRRCGGLQIWVLFGTRSYTRILDIFQMRCTNYMSWGLRVFRG